MNFFFIIVAILFNAASILAAEQPAFTLFTEFGNDIWKIYSSGKIESILGNESGINTPSGNIYFNTTAPVPSPDNKYVAFIKHNDLWLRDMKTGKSSRLTHAGKQDTGEYASIEVYITSWASDSRSILYHIGHGMTEDLDGVQPDRKVLEADYGFHIYNLDKKNSRRVSLPEGILLKWLPDHRFLYSMDDYIIIYSTDGRSEILTAANATGIQTDISRDGKHLLIADGNLKMRTSQIIKVDLATRKISPVTPKGSWADYQYPRFSRSGAQISFLKRTGQVRGHPTVSLIIDGREVYKHTGSIVYSWIDETAIALIYIREDNMLGIMVLDTGTNKIKAEHKVKRQI